MVYYLVCIKQIVFYIPTNFLIWMQTHRANLFKYENETVIYKKAIYF